MAGAFTHFILCDEGKSRRQALGPELWQLLNKHYRFLFLGAASPDLPYLSIHLGIVNWADLMHYEKTNGIVERGHVRLKKAWSSRTPADEIGFAWLMGYASHLIADATIHPVVEAIVGRYQENKEEHRLCEMTQDAIIYNICRNTEIRYSEFSEMVKFCKESKYFDGLMDFWKKLALDNYPEKGEEPHPSTWFTTYGEAIDAAEGGSEWVALFRHIGLAKGLIYKTSAEIETECPQHYVNYFAQVKVPGGMKVPFRERVFEKAIDHVVSAWKTLFEGLKSPLVVSHLVKNWNLDTGVDMESPEGTITYWA
jgi:hypothetical protein